jgi:hypothetical protein
MASKVAARAHGAAAARPLKANSHTIGYGFVLIGRRCRDGKWSLMLR